MESIKVYSNKETYKNFTIQEDFVALLNKEGNPIQITSGWNNGNNLFVYSFVNGKWEGKWQEGMGENTTEEILNLIQDYEYQKDIQKALEYAKGKKLVESNETITFTNVIAGESCNNGGEYGFYTDYEPIPKYPGIYKKITHSTCDFDSCGCGYEGIVALTKSLYRKLCKDEKGVLEKGSQY